MGLYYQSVREILKQYMITFKPILYYLLIIIFSELSNVYVHILFMKAV